MAIIDSQGLFLGDRLAWCSDMAQLHWPRLYAAANNFARMELDYRKIVLLAYSNFKTPPTEEEFWGYIREYRDNFLLFVYEADGVLWGQWQTNERYLGRYKTAEDRRSPAPPAEAQEAFRKAHLDRKKSSIKQNQQFADLLGDVPSSAESSRTTLAGVGVGVGDGVGVGVGEGEEREVHSPSPATASQSPHPREAKPARTSKQSSESGPKLKPSVAKVLKQVELQDWVDRERLALFLEMRLAKGKPVKTAGGLQALLRDLENLRDEGHDAALVIQQSIDREWQGFFGKPETLAPKKPVQFVEVSGEEFWGGHHGAR